MDQKVYFGKYNSTFVKFQTYNSNAVSEIKNFLTYKTSDFHKKYKKIDKKCLIKNNCFIPIGLVEGVIEFIQSRGYEIVCDPRIFEKNNIQKEDVEALIKKLELKHVPHYYQIDAVYKVLRNKRQLLLSPTSSGKSLIATILVMIYTLLKKDKLKQVLFVVPSKNLVDQMYYDMINYFSNNDSVDVSKLVQRIHGEIPHNKRDLSRPIVLTTWQSEKRTSFDFQNEFGSNFLQNVGMLVYDEAHLSKSKISHYICNSCYNADYRIGMTGTLFDEDDDAGFLNNQIIKGMFGEIFQTISTREMIDCGFAADIEINHLLFNFGQYDKLEYREELEEIYLNQNYFNYIVNFIGKIDNFNAICLYKSLKYGDMIKKELQRKFPNKIVYMINGSVSAKDRNDIRTLMENNKNVILLGTYQTISTGFSVKHMKYCIFVESMKSKIKCLQSLGRLLRKHKDIEKTILYDFVPIFRYKHKKGYMRKHFESRIKYFDKENHNYNIMQVKDYEWK